MFPDPGTARDWLRTELSHPEYQESLLARVARWFRELLDRLQAAAGAGGGLSPLVAVVVLVLLVALGAFLLSRLGANASARVSSTPVFTETRRTATEHRSLARTALAEGRLEEAVLESVRAVAADLFERGLVQEHADVTAHEIGESAAGLFPSHRARLARMTRAFEETRYGDRPAAEPRAQDAVALTDELVRATPGEPASSGPVAAVPQ